MTEDFDQITALRRLLNIEGRDSVTMVSLEGTTEKIPDHPSSFQEWVSTGEVAFVFVGPKDQLKAVIRENRKEGTLTVEFTFPDVVEKSEDEPA